MQKTHKKFSAFELIIGLVLIVYCAFMIIIFLWALNTSVKSDDNFLADPRGLTNSFAFENYISAFNNIKYKDGLEYKYYEMMLLNSVLYAGGCALFQVACTAVVAYCTARYKNVVSTILHYVVIITLILPIIGNTPSMIEIARKLNLYNTMIGAWIMKLGFNNMYYLIFYAAFKSLSWEFAESAFLDGANHFTVFFKIMLPLTMTLVGTVFLLYFISYWNDYQVPMLYIPKYRTAAYGLFVVFTTTVDGMAYPNVKIAGAVFIFLPIFIVFMIFKNKIMGNLTEGGIKG